VSAGPGRLRTLVLEPEGSSGPWPENPESGRRRAPAAAGVALGALTFAAYLPGLGRSLDFDSAETVGLFVRPGPPWAAFGRQTVFNNHPMFSFLEQLVRVVTGRGDAATMRVLPIACASVAVGVLTWYAARRHGPLAGLVAGIVLAANPTFVELSRSVRGYSLLTLCAVVSTVLVAEDRADRPGRYGAGYVLVAGVGLATHLYMVPVVAAHAGLVAARGRLDGRWRARLLGAGLIGGLAYAGMGRAMVDAAAAHTRVLQLGMPWRVATMATGGGWASVVVLRDRAARGAAVSLVAVLLLLWLGLRSSALSERFFVWLVPASAYLAAVAVGRMPAAAIPVAGSAALALATTVPGYTAEPTGYRQAAAVLRRVEASGGRGCVVDVGVPPMLAYLDAPRDFTPVTDVAQLDGCDVTVVAAWWRTPARWFAADTRVIAAAQRRFAHRAVLPAGDPALVLSDRPLRAWTGHPG
jgi:hypothetical protein